MREIKFRAYNTYAKCMYPADNFALRCSDGAPLQLMASGEYLPAYDVAMIYMQFIGLHDKNGKEIYEGDIVSMDAWSPKEMQIAFIEGAFCLANGKGEYVGDIHYIHHAGIEQAEIIGNIYENPHLLADNAQAV